MYQYTNNIVADMEDLLYDFFSYRHNKKQDKIKMKFTPSLIANVDFDLKCDCNYSVQNELSHELETIIDEVLNDYEYEGSPIFEDKIDREALAQIIQKVLELANERIDELKEMQIQNVNKNSILKALIEALVINNIFLKRKPIHRDFNKFVPYY